MFLFPKESGARETIEKKENCRIRESHPLLMVMASVSAKPSAGGKFYCAYVWIVIKRILR